VAQISNGGLSNLAVESVQPRAKPLKIQQIPHAGENRADFAPARGLQQINSEPAARGWSRAVARAGHPGCATAAANLTKKSGCHKSNALPRYAKRTMKQIAEGAHVSRNHMDSYIERQHRRMVGEYLRVRASSGSIGELYFAAVLRLPVNKKIPSRTTELQARCRRPRDPGAELVSTRSRHAGAIDSGAYIGPIPEFDLLLGLMRHASYRPRHR
jgi:hypothetical protein